MRTMRGFGIARHSNHFTIQLLISHIDTHTCAHTIARQKNSLPIRNDVSTNVAPGCSIHPFNAESNVHLMSYSEHLIEISCAHPSIVLKSCIDLFESEHR